MNSILQTPYGNLSVVGVAEWRRVEESHDANEEDTSLALVSFLAATECQVFAPESVARYKQEFAAERNSRYVQFVLRYEPWISWITSLRQGVGTILLGSSLLFFLIGAALILGTIAAVIFPFADLQLLAEYAALSFVGGLLCVGLDRIIAILIGGYAGRRLPTFKAQAIATPHIEWRAMGLDTVQDVPTPIADLTALLQERFALSELSTNFRLTFHADVAVGVPYPHLASKARIVDPFLVISMVRKDDRTKFSSAAIAVWDEAGFVATLHPPAGGAVSPTV